MAIRDRHIAQREIIQMRNVVLMTATRRDPVEERFAVHAQIKERLRGEVGRLKDGTKEKIASQRLLDQFDRHDPKQSNPDLVAETSKLVSTRLRRMQWSSGQMKVEQRRDLMIVLMFGSGGRLPRDQLETACAILKLRGTDKDLKDVCTVFPGFKHVFES